MLTIIILFLVSCDNNSRNIELEKELQEKRETQLSQVKADIEAKNAKRKKLKEEEKKLKEEEKKLKEETEVKEFLQMKAERVNQQISKLGQDVWDWLGEDRQNKIIDGLIVNKSGLVNWAPERKLKEEYAEWLRLEKENEYINSKKVVKVIYKDFTSRLIEFWQVERSYVEKAYFIKSVLKKDDSVTIAVLDNEKIKKFELERIVSVKPSEKYLDLLRKSNNAEQIKQLNSYKDKFDFKPLGYKFSKNFRLPSNILSSNQSLVEISLKPSEDSNLIFKDNQFAVGKISVPGGEILEISYAYDYGVTIDELFKAISDKGVLIHYFKGDSILLEDSSGYLLYIRGDGYPTRQKFTYFAPNLLKKIKITEHKKLEEKLNKIKDKVEF